MSPDGRALPFRSDEDVVRFLKTAKVESRRTLPEGITMSEQLTLTGGGRRMRAIFRTVKIQEPRVRLSNGRVRLNFRDDYIFECAAYELGRMLGLTRIPPVVERRIDGKQGSLQAWVEHSTTEKERRSSDAPVRDRQKRQEQFQILWLFDNLIENEDRHPGNILIDSQEKIWLIDHTRSFRFGKKLRLPVVLRQCDPDLFSRLKGLDESTLRTRLGRYLSTTQIKALLSRRDMLVAHFEERISRMGKKKVLVSMSL